MQDFVMQAGTNEIFTIGSFVINKTDETPTIYLVESIDEANNSTSVLYLQLNELGDDVLVMSKTVEKSNLTSINSSFLSVNGYLGYVKAMIAHGHSPMIYEVS